MKIDYSLRAQADLLNIFASLHQRAPRAAISVVGHIRWQIESFPDFPLRGMATTMPGVRRLEIGHYPYFVFYRLEGGTISIVHIRHTRRRPWQGRD